jgi:excisionase family DNA binding protein
MLDVREAARVADRSSETVRRWIWSGRLDAQRRGGRLLIARHDLEALLESHASNDSARARCELSEWVALVREQRDLRLLGEQGAHRSAAELVLSDRVHRDDR